ncbi:phage tail sheath subtilisin-like domain-containing protein [Pleomorphomonas carboxyditropha]|uniref:Phage tail protein n=1 Tax=Pleomorphomonas carboxyditropha TaxID=2023338 RepID=A0A2G9WV64_9HYPH|nr:phage tail sheath subtilisin-like domain-containing protein [Pleomorphomonas carboxyditropha]PIO98573.1 phage tail protein [Pleomorphomonas carboxyditropha]
MASTAPFVGVRVFSDLSSNVVSIDARDSTVIGMVMPAPAADETVFPLDTPVAIDPEDSELVAKLGDGLAKDAVSQVLSEGVIPTFVFSRSAYATEGTDEAKLAADIGAIAGTAADKTGAYALLDAQAITGHKPGIIIAPGYTSQRLGNLKNAATVSINVVKDMLVDCIGVVDATQTSDAAALTYAADFDTALGMMACYPAVEVSLGGETVTRPMSPHVAGAIVRRDKEAGTPYKAAWNRPLKGILGLTKTISYRDGDPSCQANTLVQGGLATVIEGNTLWAPFTTATDSTVAAYRSLKRIRTRRAIEAAIPLPMRAYLSEDLGGHLVSLMTQALAAACEEAKTLGAIIDYQIVWKRSLNSNTGLRSGICRLKLRFEEGSDLVDLQIFTEPQPEAFDVLADQIAAALQAMGNANITTAD